MSLSPRLPPRLSVSVVLASLVALAACIPGARAPNIAAQRTLEIGAGDAAGKPPSAPFGVVFAGPKGQVTDPSEVSILFNRPMRPLELAGEESAPPARIVAKGASAAGANDAIKGQWRWLGTSGLLFAPEKALPRATELTVTVPGGPSGAKALDGSTLGADYTFSFSTPRPRLVHVTPSEGSTHLKPTQDFELRFNQPVDPKEVERAITLTASKKIAIPFTVTRPKPDVTVLAKLTPKVPLPLDSDIELTVGPTLHGLEGPLPSGELRSATVRTYGPLAVREVSCAKNDKQLCVPHASVWLVLTNRVRLKDLKAHLRVEGAVLAWPKEARRDDDLTESIGIPVALEAARSVRVIVTPGLKDEFGQTLAREASFSLTVGDESPSVSIGLTGAILEASKAAGKSVEVASMNMRELEIVAAPADEAGFLSVIGDPQRRFETRYAKAKALPNASVRLVRPTTPKNVQAIERVALDPLLASGKGRGGLIIGTSYMGARSRNYDLHYVSVTDLAISARISRFGSLVMVTRLSTGKPVPNAVVSVRSIDGRELVKVTADANGFALLPPDQFRPILPSGAVDSSLVIVARSGDDWTYREANDSLMHADTPPTDLSAAMTTFGMLFTDRGIYKVGETIRLKGVFRKPNPNGLDTPRGKEITIHAYDPEGAPLVDHKAKLGSFGEMTLDIPIPKSSHLGRVFIEARADDEATENAYLHHAATTSVDIAAYRPAEFKVSVDPSLPAFVRGDTATFTSRGDYLFGAPMTGGRVRFTATRSRAWFVPPGFDDAVVSDSAFTSASPDASSRGGRLQSGEGQLGEKGTFDAKVGLVLPKQDGPEQITFEAEIEDVSRQTVASQATALVHPGEFYVALRSAKDLFLPGGATIKPEIATVEPSGGRRTGIPVHLELIARTWHTVTEATGEYGFHYESRPVDKTVATCDVASSSAWASCDLKAPEPGYFLVRASAKDKRQNPLASSYGVYVSGDEASVTWPIYDGSRLDLVLDKTSYEIGDTAKVLVKSPWKEAEALVTIERQGIHEKRRMTVTGSMPTVSIPVTDTMWPNTFVSIELVKGRTAAAPANPSGSANAKAAPKKGAADIGAPAYRLGYAEISVNPEGRRLKVDVKPARKDYRPGEEVDAELVVRDRAGKPVRADVAFYAVDEGVLMLTGYKTPDPIPVFAARRMLSVAPVESRDDLARLVRLSRGPGEDKGDEGGGGADGPSAREDFRSTAYFLPSIVTGADGKAKVRFKLPDSLTTYRLMAVASSEEHRFGFGQEQIQTSRPLMARPALPRFLRAGDVIEAGVILTSKGMGAQPVEVTIDAKGVDVLGDKKRTVSLPANGTTEVKWSIVSPTAGAAELGFTANARGATDKVVVKREVMVPLSPEAVALYGDTEGAIAERLGDLKSMRSDVGGLDLRVASTALVGLDSGVDALMQYPYGCAEQLTSRMVPLVALADLAKDYAIALPKDPNGAVDDAVVKILKSQRADGGFGYWPDAPSANTWLTAYALWGLHLAKERGRPVPTEALDGAVRWLRAKVAMCGATAGSATPAARSLAPLCEKDGVTLSEHAFVLDVLAMTGKPDAGYMNRLFERRAAMPLFARALLAHAMAISKMRVADAAELVRDAENHLRISPTGAIVAENLGDAYTPLLDSEARTTAIVLRSLVTIDPKHPLAARLAKGLLAARRGGAWRTTQENAWALLSLDAYRKAQEATAPDFDANVFFGDKQVFSAAFHGRTVKSQSVSFPASALLAKSGENLAFQVDGKGRLFYEARLRYAKKELPHDALDRGFYVRKLMRSVKPDALADAMRVIPQTSANSAQTSDLVLVDLLVVTSEPREQVVIDDPLPAGLEPVQSQLATTARDLAVTEPGGEGDDADVEDARDRDERAMGRTYQSSWYHREMHDDRVLTFVDRMPAGMYHYRYLARATTPGRFVVPPTRAECMYEPETFGRTGAVSFEVKASK